MPLVRCADGANVVWIRPPYKAADYTVPQAELDRLKRASGYLGPDDVFTLRDGPFVSYLELGSFSRGGKQWFLLWNASYEYCIEVEAKGVSFGEVIPVPPQKAWELSVEQDKRHPGKVVYT